MKKIAFLDRDGVINKKAAEHCYVQRPEDFVLNPGIIPLLQNLIGKGYEFIVITNQRGIARGLFSEEDLARVHAAMSAALKAEGIEYLDVFHCPHESNSCECRKPRPGLLRKACSIYPINLRDSILISDSPDDVLMGQDFGIGRCFAVPCDKPEELLGNSFFR